MHLQAVAFNPRSASAEALPSPDQYSRQNTDRLYWDDDEKPLPSRTYMRSGSTSSSSAGSHYSDHHESIDFSTLPASATSKIVSSQQDERCLIWSAMNHTTPPHELYPAALCAPSRHVFEEDPATCNRDAAVETHPTRARRLWSQLPTKRAGMSAQAKGHNALTQAQTQAQTRPRATTTQPSIAPSHTAPARLDKALASLGLSTPSAVREAPHPVPATDYHASLSALHHDENAATAAADATHAHLSPSPAAASAELRRLVPAPLFSRRAARARTSPRVPTTTSKTPTSSSAGHRASKTSASPSPSPSSPRRLLNLLTRTHARTSASSPPRSTTAAGSNPSPTPRTTRLHPQLHHPQSHLHPKPRPPQTPERRDRLAAALERARADAATRLDTRAHTHVGDGEGEAAGPRSPSVAWAVGMGLLRGGGGGGEERRREALKASIRLVPESAAGFSASGGMVVGVGLG